jgi:hypothetical protein
MWHRRPGARRGAARGQQLAAAFSHFDLQADALFQIIFLQVELILIPEQWRFIIRIKF